MSKFLLFQKHLNKSTWKSNSDFCIITQISTRQKQSLRFTVTSQNTLKYKFIFILHWHWIQ